MKWNLEKKKRWLLTWKGILKIKSVRVLTVNYIWPLTINKYNSHDKVFEIHEQFNKLDLKNISRFQINKSYLK